VLQVLLEGPRDDEGCHRNIEHAQFAQKAQANENLIMFVALGDLVAYHKEKEKHKQKGKFIAHSTRGVKMSLALHEPI
jgi:hypothetical protein